MRIADFSIKHPAIIAIVLVAVILFGFIALGSLRLELFGDFEMPTLIVITAYPGAGPKDVEREVTSVLEEEIAVLSGVTSLSSSSYDSVSLITIEFDWNTDLADKTSDLRECLTKAASALPDGIQGEPTILKMSATSLAIVSISVESDTDTASLSEYVTETIIPRIMRVPGVGLVNTAGLPEEIVNIRLNISELEAKKVSILDIFQLLKYNNVTFPAGSVVFRGNSLNVRTVGQFNSLEEIENLIVGYRDETFIRLKDVAHISIKAKPPRSYVDGAGESLVVMDVMKQGDADSVEVIDLIKKVCADIEEETGGAVRFKYLSDSSADIRLAINSVRDSAFMGAILAVLVLFLFLHNVRTTLIIGISIPLSILLSFIAMSMTGQTINIMTLGGVTVAIGMIVDASIVVLENTHKHFLLTGDRKKAAALGASEVGGAVIASTTTTLAVFVPLLFVKGFAGRVLRDVCFSIIWAITASTIVAVIVVPFLSALWLKKDRDLTDMRILSRISSLIEKLFGKLTAFYQRSLEAALRNRKFVLFLSVSILVLSALAFGFLGFEFLAESDMNEINVTVETPAGYTLEQTREKMLRIEEVVRELVPEIDNAVFFTGQSSSFGLLNEPNTGYARIRLVSTKKRERSVFEIIDQLQTEIPSRIPDVSLTVVNGGYAQMVSLATGGAGLIVEVYGKDLDEVAAAARAVQAIMDQDPYVSTTSMNISFNRQEVISNLSIDYMGTLGVTPYEGAVTSRILFNGMEVGTYREGSQSYPIFLDSTIAGQQVSEDILNQLSLKSQSGEYISFANFSELSIVPTVDAITHNQRLTSILVTGHLTNTDLGGGASRMTEKLTEFSFPAGVQWEISGSAKEMISSFKTLLFAMGIAVFLVYMVMVIQFERFTQPLIILASIPFTLIGVIGSLLLFRSTLSIVSFLGIIALAGTVVNNAIVLIDYTNLLRKRDGLGLLPAILKGGASRLKPILMTTITTILGVIPMALAVGEGSEVYAPLGQTIGGGLITSTLITLYLIPVLYYMLESGKLHRAHLKAEEEREAGIPVDSGETT